MHVNGIINVKINGSFNRDKLSDNIDDKLSSYDYNEYMELTDRDIKFVYEYCKIPLVFLSNGSVYTISDFHKYYSNYIIIKSKIYKMNYGKAHTTKRDKFCKKTKVKYTVLKRYFSKHDILTKIHGFVYKDGRYYIKQEELFDWYVIGGNYGNQFLVKESVKNCIEIYALGSDIKYGEENILL